MTLFKRGEQSGIEAQTARHGYPIAVRAVRMGHRCGYVGIPPEHPLYGVPYWPDESDPAYTIMSDIDIHGGLTYAASGSEDEDAYPSEGNYWWFGFDCAHYMDAKDPEILEEFGTQKPHPAYNEGTVKTLSYVLYECSRLADQLYAVKDARIEDLDVRRAFMTGYTRTTTWEAYNRKEHSKI